MRLLPNIHWTSAARDCCERKAIHWVHLSMGNPVPPTFDGSYNHLIWDLACQRAPGDLVVVDYFPDSFRRAEAGSVPVVQIELPGTLTKMGVALRRRLCRRPGNGLYTTEQFFLEQAASVIRQVHCKKIMLWGTIRFLPELRRLLPNHVIAFAQRHYDYPVHDLHYNLCDYVVMQTKGQLRHAFSRMPHLSPPAVVIPNGVELEVFKPVAAAQRAALREKHGLPSNRFVALFPSKLAPYKGASYLREWIGWAAKELQEVFFLVVGKLHASLPEAQRRELEKTLTTSANVKWLGAVPRTAMPELYACADVCLMPGLWREGFSMAATEALAAGLPVIASHAGCYPEIITDGYNGILCPQEDLLRSVLDALRRLATDPALALQMSRNARRYAERRLPREKVLANFAAFLDGHYTRIDDDLSIPA